MSVPETLFELLNTYEVLIPIIQRDYVQGFNDKIIKELIMDIKVAINNQQHQLRLNFIYGKVDIKENRQLFIPLDGQQRLTTLFLVHIFAFRESEIYDAILKRFTYETRRSSRVFFELLCDSRYRNEVLNGCDEPSTMIKNSAKFHTKWLNDPSIVSALKCLDTIKDILGEEENLVARLVSNEYKPVVFSFIPISNMGIVDNVYIKLNARGVPLTKFEIYKGTLLKRIDENNREGHSSISKFDFAQKLDTKWSDFFWDIQKEDTDGNDNFQKFDIYFRNFFAILFSDLVQEKDSSNTQYTFVEKITFEKLLQAYYLLDFLSSKSCVMGNHTRMIVDRLLKCIQSETPSYYDRVIFNAVALFFGESKGKYKLEQLDGWFRVIRNLTDNSTIDRPDTYRYIRESLRIIGPNCMKINDFLVNPDTILSGFSAEQLKEERIKSYFILKGIGEKEIYNAESHGYFSGQIRSALSLEETKLDTIMMFDENGLRDKIKDFESKWSVIKTLFDDEGPISEYALRKALLSYRDYTMSTGQYKSLCVKTPSEPISLKALFSSNDPSVLKLIQALLPIKSDLRNQELENIADRNILGIQKNDWRFWMIKYANEMMGYMSDSYMRIYSDNNHLLLINGKSSSGKCREIFTYALQLELVGRGINAIIPEIRGRNESYFISINEFTISYNNEKYILKNNDNFKVEFNDMDGLINRILEISQ